MCRRSARGSSAPGSHGSPPPADRGPIGHQRLSRYPPLFGIKTQQALTVCGTDAALRDDAGDQACGSHVESQVEHRAAFGYYPDTGELTGGRAADDLRDLRRRPLLDLDVAAVLEIPVDGADGQRRIERHFIVFRRQRLEVRSHLVADVTACCGAVAADDDTVDLAALHEEAAEVVYDDGVRNTVRAQLISGK